MRYSLSTRGRQRSQGILLPSALLVEVTNEVAGVLQDRREMTGFGFKTKFAQMLGSRQEGTGGGLACLLLTGDGSYPVVPQTPTMPGQRRVNEPLLLHVLHHKFVDRWNIQNPNTYSNSSS